ncbi:MAG TPA: hypothetical protein VF067_07510, partial [Sphingomicrobium sp.]
MTDFTALRLSATASVLALAVASSPAVGQTGAAGQPAVSATAPAEATPAACINVPAGPAHDQCVVRTRQAQGETPTAGESIVVTGTRINRPTQTSS